MNKTVIPIKGMHCRSCEILVESELRENPDIKGVQVSYKKSEALVFSKQPLQMDKIKLAIAEAGYEVGVDDSKSWINLDPQAYKDLFISFLILIYLYYTAKNFGLFNIDTGLNNRSSLFIVFLIGLTAGISTCMALVGGLILGISAKHAEKHPEATPLEKFRPHIYFNLGRISFFFLFGGAIGIVGKAFQLSGTWLGILTLGVGVVMLILGLQLTELFPRLSNGGLTLPSSISKILGIRKSHDKEYSHTNSMLIGALTFFLPCGFTQAMQLYAMSSGSFWSGATIMGLFAIGTAPGLLGIGGVTSLLKGAFAKKFFKFTGLLVIGLAIFNISNGYNLTGWKIRFSNDTNQSIKSDVLDPNVIQENGVQVVNMTELQNGYKPNQFTIKQGIPVKWIIDAEAPNSCAGSIIMPKMGIKKLLVKGENIINFTPTDVGELKFSCSMGMYTGKFNVIKNESSSQAPKTEAKDQVVTNSQSEQSTPSSSPSDIDLDSNEIQKIQTTYISNEKDIAPNEFTVSVNKPVRFEVSVKEISSGCMSSITIPGLTDDIYDLYVGKTVVFEFTPKKTGIYEITCGMGVPRGTITVV